MRQNSWMPLFWPPRRRWHSSRRRSMLLAISLLLGIGHSLSPMQTFFYGRAQASDENEKTPSGPNFQVALIGGRVVWYGPALKRRFGIGTVPEAAERVLALETTEGRLIPLVEDLRTRAFRRDQRLREMQVELLVRQYDDTPALRILSVYEVLDDQKYEVDYWCDICAIPMYETGPCACCQQENRLRKRKVDANP